MYRVPFNHGHQHRNVSCLLQSMADISFGSEDEDDDCDKRGGDPDYEENNHHHHHQRASLAPPPLAPPLATPPYKKRHLGGKPTLVSGIDVSLETACEWLVGLWMLG